MALQNQPTAAYRGHRRHRYMETSDFNAAAKRMFKLIRRTVAIGDPIEIGSAFFSIMMDPTTPGHLESFALVPTRTGRLAAALGVSSDQVVAKAAGIGCLLAHPENPAPLVAWASYERSLVRLELHSVDTKAMATYTLRADAKKLDFAPLQFRR